ncbi:MAG: hypothetical protein FJ009_09640 [Chloroflexi bacterium]|nr:hypothetical protein [Chloroflexota bacterium]
MNHVTPGRLVGLGILLMVLGIILPFLMLIQILESTLLLNFFAYLASVLGLVLGMIGALIIARSRQHDQ